MQHRPDRHAVDHQASTASWRTPAVIVVCGCLIATISYGPRSSFGFFMSPMTADNGWGRDVFALSVALQTLIYGMVQPFSGAIADKFGTIRVIIAGAMLYASGVYMMAQRHDARRALPDLRRADRLRAYRLLVQSHHLVVREAAAGRLALDLVRRRHRGGLVRAVPVLAARREPDRQGRVATTLEIFAGILLLIIPLSLAIATSRQDAPAKPGAGCRRERRAGPDLEAGAERKRFGHRSFVLLVLGYFTCGFQLQFVTLHLPSYLIDRGLSAEVGGWTLGIIGLFNIVGALLSGYLASRMPKRYILAVHLFDARAGGDLPHHHAGVAGGGADLWRGDRLVVAVVGAADLGPGRRDVRHALACDADRHHLPQPSDRRLARRLSRRRAL